MKLCQNTNAQENKTVGIVADCLARVWIQEVSVNTDEHGNDHMFLLRGS